MKVIPLKKVFIDYDGDAPEGAPKFLDYRSTIMSLLKTPKDPSAGATFEETAEAMPIWMKIRKHEMPAMGDSEILLEDAEHKFIVDCLTNAKYVQRTFELYEMIKSVKDAPDHLADIGKKEA